MSDTRAVLAEEVSCFMAGAELSLRLYVGLIINRFSNLNRSPLLRARTSPALWCKVKLSSDNTRLSSRYIFKLSVQLLSLS